MKVLMASINLLLLTLSPAIVTGQASQRENAENQLEKKLSESEIPELKRMKELCGEKKADERRECLYTESKKIKPEQIEQLLKDFNLERGFNDPQLNSDKENYSKQRSRAIRQYFTERLGKAFYGEDYVLGTSSLPEQRLVDQRDFNNLYASHLWQKAYLEISTFCRDQVSFKDIKKALASMKNKKMVVEGIIGQCEARLAEKCQSYVDSPENKNFQSPDEGQALKACLGQRRMRQIYRALAANNRILSDEMDEEQQGQVLWGQGDNNSRIYQSQGQDKSTDSMAVITSQDFSNIVDDRGDNVFHDPESGDHEFREKCMKNASSDDCKKYLKLGYVDSIEDFALEHEMATAIKEQYLSGLARKDKKEALRKYLINQGLRVELQKLDETQDVQKVVEEVSRKYRAERVAVIESLKKRFGDSEDSIGFSEDEDLSSMSNKTSEKIERVAAELEKEKKELESAFLFHNVMQFAGLTIRDEEDKSKSTQNYWNSLEEETKALQEAGVDGAYVENMQSMLDRKTSSNEEETSQRVGKQGRYLCGQLNSAFGMSDADFKALCPDEE